MASIQSDSQKDISQQLMDGLRPMSLGKLVSNPLVACVKAQYKSIEAAYDVILNQSFKKVQDNPKERKESVEPIFITFSYPYKGRVYQLKVPLFTLIPISYLEIQQANFSFAAELKVESSEGIKGVLCRKRNESINRTAAGHCTIDYNINMGQCDMTAGLAAILQLCEENVVVDCIDLPIKQVGSSGGKLSTEGILHSINTPRYSSYTSYRSSYSSRQSSSSGGELSLSGILRSIDTPRYGSYTSYGSSYSSRRVGSSGGNLSLTGILRSIDRARYGSYTSYTSSYSSKYGGSSNGTLSLNGILQSINRRRWTPIGRVYIKRITSSGKPIYVSALLQSINKRRIHNGRTSKRRKK